MDDRDILARNTEEINTLFMLSQSLTEVLNIEEVLHRVVESARHLTNADEGMILLPEGENLYLRAKVGVDLAQLGNFRVKTSDTVAGRVFHTGKPILVGASGPQKIKTEYLVHSLLYVPIVLKGQVMGILGVNNRQKKDQFTTHDRDLLTNLASFAAIALENARIHQESLERSDDLERIITAGDILNDSLSLSDTLLRICSQLFDILSVHHVSVLRWDEDVQQLQMLAWSDRMTWRFGRGPQFLLDDQPTLKTALENDHFRWLSMEKAGLQEQALLAKTDSQTALFIPIILRQKPLGCFRFFYTHPPIHRPSGSILQQVHQTGLQNLADLLDNPSRVVTERTLRSLKEMNQMTGSDWCDLVLPTSSPQRMAILVRVGSKLWIEPPAPFFDLTQHTDLLQALEMSQLLHGKNDTAPSLIGIRALMKKSETSMIVGVPLIRGGQSQGMVLLGSTQPDRVLTPREINIARAIVGQAATALENATLVHELEQNLRVLKETQDRLIQTARLSAMGELAMVVAHQINNPLTTIIADTDLLLLDEPKDSANYEILQTIARTGRRAANVARRLLAIARPVDPAAQPDSVDVVQSLREVLLLLRAHIERKGIQLQQKFPLQPLPPVSAIKGQLADVWINLLMNAYDALGNQVNGEIGIDVIYHAPSRYIQVVIWDTGPGVPEYLQAKIFSPFFTTKPAGEGTGIGLHICHEIVENIGGVIQLESAPGQPTRFIVSLPVS